MGKDTLLRLPDYQCRADRRPWLRPHIHWRMITSAKGMALSAAVLFALLASGTARADVIDGTWCSPDSRVLSIQGPEITTPGKHKLVGNYSRHHFSYVVPDGEDGAGATVEMFLLNEQTMQLQPPNGEMETWKRCEIIS